MASSSDKQRAGYYYWIECNGTFELAIQKNAEVPFKAKRYFTTYEDNQIEMEIKVNYKEEPSLQSNGANFSLKLNGIRPQPKGSAVFEVCLCIDSSNVCYASLEELTTGKKHAYTFKGLLGWSFNMGEMENIIEDVKKPPGIIHGMKRHSEVEMELKLKLKLLKELKDKTVIESEYLDEVIQIAENYVGQSTIPEELEMKEMIKEVEKITSLFYKSEFKLEGDLGIKGNDHIWIPKTTKLPCKMVMILTTSVDGETSGGFQVSEGEGPFLEGSNFFGEVILDGITPLPKGHIRFESCLEICTFGVLYASIEDLSTRRKSMAIIHKGMECSKREVEEKLNIAQIIVLSGRLGEYMEEVRKLKSEMEEERKLNKLKQEKLIQEVKSVGEMNGEEIKTMIAWEFEKYKLEMEEQGKIHWDREEKMAQELEKYKFKTEAQGKEISELREEIKKMKLQKEN